MKTLLSSSVTRTIGSALLAALTLTVAARASDKHPQHYEMTLYAAPNGETTLFRDINNQGTIVGSATAAGELPKGLILQRGNATPVTLPEPGFVQLLGVAGNGWALGEFDAEDFSTVFGFLRSPRGEVTPLPTVGPDVHQLVPGGLNDRGMVVGAAFGEFDGVPGGRAFVYERGAYSFYSAPSDSALYITFTGVNDAGKTVGIWVDFEFNQHAFSFYQDTFTDIVIPGADRVSPMAINNQGQIAGIYTAGGATYGFMQENGETVTFDYSGLGRTGVFGLNDNGDLVGAYFGEAGVQGLLITPVSGN